jgi:hypothetical protein
MAVNDFGNEFPTRVRPYSSRYSQVLEQEAEASVKLDGETQDVGPVTVGHKSVSEIATDFEEWNQRSSKTETAFLFGYDSAIQDLESLADELEALEQNQVQRSRIRVKLSRPLTWAEKEWLETDLDDPHLRRVNLSDHPDTDHTIEVVRDGNGEFTYVWVEADFGSRIAFDIVAQILEQEFVNVFPRAVRTDREYNGE